MAGELCGRRVAQGAAKFRTVRGFVFSLEHVPHGTEAASMVIAGFYPSPQDA